MARLTPKSAEEAQSILAQGGRVLFVGGGTKLRPGPPVDVEICTAGLNRIVEYVPSDQVAIVEAGVTLAALQRELTHNGQRLALDPPFAERATIGGIVAANSFGPLRTRYGSVRDLIIGISILRADGTAAKGGGKVVKTVAGFDLPKLMCGSQGTLAMIVTATFRVHPLPEAKLTLVARSADPMEMVRKVRALQLEPAAMLARRERQGWDVFLRFEGFRAGLLAQREKLRELSESDWPSDEPAAGVFRVRFAALPTQIAQVEKALAPVEAQLSWLPTLGIGFGEGGNPAALAHARRELAALGGWLAVESGPEGLDDFGPPPESLRLHQAVKARFDPHKRLAPGRFIGGI